MSNSTSCGVNPLEEKQMVQDVETILEPVGKSNDKSDIGDIVPVQESAEDATIRFEPEGAS